jgi:glutathione S-transferase
VRKYLAAEFGADEAGQARWVDHWLTVGFTALEATLARREIAWPFCFGDTPGWADLHLVPQIGNARRFAVDLAPYPLLMAVEARCAELPAFQNARPEAQSDAPKA